MKKRWAQSAAILTTILSAASVSAGNADTQATTSIDETITFFYYKDLEAQVPFYEELLGLKKTMDMDWVKIYRITKTSSVGLVLQGHGAHDVAEDKPVMLSIVTGDVDAWYERLEAANVRVLKELPAAVSESEPDRAPVRSFLVEDPGGYTIEFFSWQTISDH